MSTANEIGQLLERAVEGERRALGRLLTLVEAGGTTADELAELVHTRANGTAPVIGITGAPGTGKSTLVGHLVTEMAGAADIAGTAAGAGTADTGTADTRTADTRTADTRTADTRTADTRTAETRIAGKAGAAGELTARQARTAQQARLGGKPAILAVDPSSPLTGGAILGDRIRMDGVAAGRAFIRSMATRGHAGGLALAVPGALRLFEACGFAPLLVETVGVGQVEVDVTRTADTTVVMVAPGMGDAVQANKAGLLEVADVLVVNKADRPGAGDTRRDLKHMLDLGHTTGLTGLTGLTGPAGQTQHWRPEIIMTTATTGDGADQVHRAVQAHRAHLAETGQLHARRQSRIRQEVLDRVTQHLDAAASHYLSAYPDELREALDGHNTPAATAAAITERLLSNQPPS